MFSKISKLLIYLLIVLVPLTHKEMFSIFDPDLVLSKFILIVVALLGVCYVLRDIKCFIRDSLFLLLGSIVFFQVLSLTQSGDIPNSLRMIGFQSAVLFSYPTLKKYISSQNGSIVSLGKIYLLTFFGVFVFLLYQMYLQENFGIATGGVWPVPGNPARYGSTFWDINHFGAYLSSLFFFVLGLLLYLLKGLGGAPNFFNRKFIAYYLGLAGILFALYFTSSRSSMISFGFGIIFFVLIYIKSIKGTKFSYNNKFWYLAGIISATVPIFLLIFFMNRIRAAFLYRSVSFFSHLFLLKVGFSVGIENFLFGIGTNSFYTYFKGSRWADVYYYIDEAALSYKLPLHNLWLEVSSETGIISLIFFALLWSVLLKGLYERVTGKVHDFVSLGLFAGIVSFLVGGFMYSYKSEFFWVYVIIACAYLSSHQKNSPLNSLFDFKMDFKNILLLVLSSAALVIPVFYITHTLTFNEIGVFNADISSNPLISSYQYLLNLFRYVFGNYAFTGRGLSFLFYVSSIFMLFGILRKTCSPLHSLVSTAIVVHLIAIFNPIMEVSMTWYIGFLTLVGFSVITSIIKPRGYFACQRTWENKGLYILALIFAIFLSSYSSYRGYKNSYDSDLSFLVELSANRRLLDQSNIWVDKSIDSGFVHFYCDKTEKIDDGFVILPCNLNEFSGNYVIDASGSKIVIIGKKFIFENKGSFVANNTAYKKRDLISGDYQLVIYEAVK